MKIEFLGHAGFWLKINDIEIVIDAWLIPTSFEHPVLNSFVPDHKTIDYLIPEARCKVEEISPDIILLSHYHTHHSPKIEIENWLKKSNKKITLLGPEISRKHKKKFDDEFKVNYPSHEFIQYNFDAEFFFKEIKIKLLTHTIPQHFSFVVEHKNKKFMHIADASISRTWYDRRLDPVWFKYKNISPDYLALTVGHTSARKTNSNKENYIVENCFMSPAEAANLVKFINAKNVSIIGIFNFSIWKNRTEYGYPYAEVENYFRWAVQHVSSKINTYLARPGNEYHIKSESEFFMKIACDN